MRTIDAPTIKAKVIIGSTRRAALDAKASKFPMNRLSSRYDPVMCGGGEMSMSMRPVGGGAI